MSDVNNGRNIFDNHNQLLDIPELCLIYFTMSYLIRQLNRDGDRDGPSEEDIVLQNQWISFGSRVAIRIALHPFEYAKVLIQVGHHIRISVPATTNQTLSRFQLGYEPIKPRMGKTLFGQPALVYPNVFQYGGFHLQSIFSLVFN